MPDALRELFHGTSTRWVGQCEEAKSHHPGLLWGKNFSRWELLRSDQGKFDEKKRKNLLEQLIKDYEKTVALHEVGEAYDQYVSAWRARFVAPVTGGQSPVLRQRTVLELKLRTPMLIGKADASVVEGAVRLHHLTGAPVIPATSLKGAVIHDLVARGDPNAELLRRELQAENDDETQGQLGTIPRSRSAVFDALPRSYPKLSVNMGNPHVKGYYQSAFEEGDGPIVAPADWDEPEPFYFLTVAEGAVYWIPLAADSEEQLNRLSQAVLNTLSDAGVGAKTSSDYGSFLK